MAGPAGEDAATAPDEASGEDRAERPERLEDSDFLRRLREAGAGTLALLLRERLSDLSPAAARQALHNPFSDTEVVELIAGQGRLLSYYEVRRELALHPRTPEILALRFLPGLYWRDLMTVGGDTRLRPGLRRSAELKLIARLPELAVGEKISLARRASGGVVAQLRHDRNPRVVEALLDNPRLTEGALAPLLHSAATPAPILDLVMADRRWGVRYALRLAVARNPSAADPTVLRLLPGLRKPDLRVVAGDPKLSPPVRQRARLLLGESA